MTNADRIRSMTNEELAEILVLADNAPESMGCVERLCTADKRCENCVLAWLESPCEDPDTELDKQ
jgi:hypothetical protein